MGESPVEKSDVARGAALPRARKVSTMPGKYSELRREMRANFELTWGGQADSNKRIEEIANRLDSHSTKLEEQADKIVEQGQKIARQGQEIARQGQEIARQGEVIAEQNRQMAVGIRETARLGREVVAIGHQMEGRFRLMNDRFGKFLDVLETEATDQGIAIKDLEARVTRLEERQGPAA